MNVEKIIFRSRILLISTVLSLLTMLQSATAQQPLYPNVPGVVIDHSPASSGQYIGSPSVCVLANGDYVASHDFFGPKSSQLTHGVTCIFQSHNHGKTWQKTAEIKGQFWSTLFTLNDTLYIIGTSHEYGNVVIRKSADNGYTWTEPADSVQGLLREGKYHTAPTPVVVQNGRVWRAMEHVTGSAALWAKAFHAFVLSAPVESNLLAASSWTNSAEAGFDYTYLNGAFEGWLEGNAVVDTNGEMVDILRVATQTAGKEHAAVIRIGKDGKESHFNAETDFIDFPGGSKKFTIRYDAKFKRYWTLSNYIPEGYRNLKNTGAVRNTLALCSSADTRNWKVNKIILHHPDENKHGFQYVDWQFVGDDIIFVSRTAFDDGEGGADNYHNANFLTFHRIKKFRKLAQKTIG